MADNMTKEQRSYCMSRIKRSHTKPELILKDMLKNFEHDQKGIFGNPDFINWVRKIVIFIDGCFWHKCPEHFKWPRSNQGYWTPKIKKNVIRDKEVSLAYKSAGWKVVRIWEHELKQSVFCQDTLKRLSPLNVLKQPLQ